MRAARLGALLTSLALAAWLLAPFAAAEGPVPFEGRVINASTGQPPPPGLQVTLHAFQSTGEVTTEVAATELDGSFQLSRLSDAGARYSLSTTYQDVTYTVEPGFLGDATLLRVFDTTDDLSSLRADSHIWIIREVDQTERTISLAEVVLLSNDSDRAFKPTLRPASRMNLLRFSLPPQISDLEVQSDLQSGDIINVGTGFGLTSAVPPGAHQITYTYSLPYDGEEISLSPAFLQGVDVFRILVPDGLGEAAGPELLETESVDIGDAAYRVWSSRSLSPGQRLSVTLANLPQPSLWQMAARGGRIYLIGIPSILGLGLAAVLGYALMLRRRPGPEEAVHPLPDDVHVLTAEIAQLDDLYEDGVLNEPDYRERRTRLKLRLLQASKQRGHGSEEETP